MKEKDDNESIDYETKNGCNMQESGFLVFMPLLQITDFPRAVLRFFFVDPAVNCAT